MADCGGTGKLEYHHWEYVGKGQDLSLLNEGTNDCTGCAHPGCPARSQGGVDTEIERENRVTARCVDRECVGYIDKGDCSVCGIDWMENATAVSGRRRMGEADLDTTTFIQYAQEAFESGQKRGLAQGQADRAAALCHAEQGGEIQGLKHALEYLKTGVERGDEGTLPFLIEMGEIVTQRVAAAVRVEREACLAIVREKEAAYRSHDPALCMIVRDYVRGIAAKIRARCQQQEE